MAETKTPGKRRTKKQIEADAQADSGSDDSSFDVVQIDEEVDMANIEQIDSPADPRWTSHVLSHLEDDEKQDDYPKTDGLRRLVHKFIGPIVRYDVDVNECPRHGAARSDSNTATVTVTISVVSKSTGETLVYSSVGDANELSCMPPYNKFLSPIAETRAEGRCYRKILGLKNIVTADEIDRNGSTLPPLAVGAANDAQIFILNELCKRQNLNVQAVVTGVYEQHIKKDVPSNIRKCQEEDLKIILDKLHNTDHKKVDWPDKFRGYESGWKEYFG